MGDSHSLSPFHPSRCDGGGYLLGNRPKSLGTVLLVSHLTEVSKANVVGSLLWLGPGGARPGHAAVEGISIPGLLRFDYS